MLAMVERMYGTSRFVRDAAVDLVLAVASGRAELHQIATTLEAWARIVPAAS
jgi:hypothetical protein